MLHAVTIFVKKEICETASNTILFSFNKSKFNNKIIKLNTPIDAAWKNESKGIKKIISN
jgi:hypothetical protein